MGFNWYLRYTCLTDFDWGADWESVLAGTNSARAAVLTRWDEIPGGGPGDRGGDPVGGE